MSMVGQPRWVHKISENTLVPLSFLGILAGGVFWLSTIWSDTRANAKAVTEIKEQQEEYLRIVRTIDTRLSRIEGKLGVKDGY